MELAIFAGVGLLGYQMSRGGQAAKVRDDEPKAVNQRKNEYPARGGAPAMRQMRKYNARAAKRWEQSLQPHLTGIVTPQTARDAPGMLPFFKSMRAQNTNDAVKQTRMELFTGEISADSSATGTYRKKIELARAHPTNGQQVSSSGTSGNPAESRDSGRYVVTNLHNNVSPVPQMRVGPGLGLGSNDAARDGFHPMLRVLPVNVGDYKKNPMPGAVNHGGSTVAVGSNRLPHAKNRADTPMAEGCNRDIAASRAAYTAPMVQPLPGRDAVGRLAGHEYYGGSAHQNGSTVYAIAEDRLKSDDNPGFAGLNLAGAAATAPGVGKYVNATYDTARFASQQRETQTGHWGFVQAADPDARTVSAGHILPPTHRNNTALDALRHGSLGHGSGVPIGSARAAHRPQRTLREDLVSGQGPINLATTQRASTLDNTARDVALEREAKRASQVVDYATAPGRMNVYGNNGGNVRVRSDRNVACVGSHATARSKTKHVEKLGSLNTNYNKLQPGNPWSETLDLARTQLGSNALALPAFSS
jgi:hypothetical protein